MAVSQRQRKADEHRVRVGRNGISIGDGAVAALAAVALIAWAVVKWVF